MKKTLPKYTQALVMAGLVTITGTLWATSELTDESNTGGRNAPSTSASVGSSIRSRDISVTATGQQEVKASKLIGKHVKNDENQTIGKVKDVILDVDSGNAPYAILTTGGAAGLGAKHIAVPLSSLHYNGEGAVTLSATREQLKSASISPEGNWAAVSGQAWTREVDGYYSQPESVTEHFEREAAQLPTTNPESVRFNKKAAEQTMDMINNEGAATDYSTFMKSQNYNSSQPVNDSTVATSDMALKRQVKQTIQNNFSNTTAQRIQVSVNSGTVTLMGTVPTQGEKDGIESRVKDLSGVQQVDNQLLVGNQ